MNTTHIAVKMNRCYDCTTHNYGLKQQNNRNNQDKVGKMNDAMRAE